MGGTEEESQNLRSETLETLWLQTEKTEQECQLQLIKERYSQFKEATEYIKVKIVPLIRIISMPPAEISKIRKKMLEIFNQDVARQTCGGCQGSCCGRPDSYLRIEEIIYFCVIENDFSIPEPDWEFLQSRKKRSCMFLGPSGCLLKDNRPIACLNACCPDLASALNLSFGNQVDQIGNQADQMAQKMDQWRRRLNIEQYTDTWYYCEEIPNSPKILKDIERELVRLSDKIQKAE